MKTKTLALTFLLAPLAFAAPKITNMHNTALQKEINTVQQVNFDPSLMMARAIWKQKRHTLYHSTLPGFKNWRGARVYHLIRFAMARENERLVSSPTQDNSIVMQLTGMLRLLEKTTDPDRDIFEARMLFSQALMLEEIRLYHVHTK